jgi:hypothetical protein
MPREPLPPEVARYLVERRVLVTTAEPGRVIAAVLGDTIAEIIQHRSAKGWWCTCQQSFDCPHIAAMQSVTCPDPDRSDPA